MKAAPGLLTRTVYVTVSPGPALSAETLFTTVGSTSRVFVTVLLTVGDATSVEVTLALLEIVYGVSETASVVFVATVTVTVAVSPGFRVPTFQVTVPAALLQELPPEQLT